MGENDLRLEAYNPLTTLIIDPQHELQRAQRVRFSTGYPGGLYLSASFSVPRRAAEWWAVKGAQRLAIRNGLKIVWEGQIDNLAEVVAQPGEEVTVSASGYWGAIGEARRWRKFWADQRFGQDCWAYQTDTTVYLGAEKCGLDRYNRVRFTPKGVAWASGDFAAVRYTMPTGQTVKRLVYNYDLAEGGQAWEISVWRSTDGAAWTQMTNASGETYAAGTTTVITATSTGSVDVALQTASQYVELRFYARGNQTPTEDGAYYGQFSSLTAYSETGAIDSTEIIKDVQGKITSINADTNYIGSNTFDLTPFVIDDWEAIAEIMSQAASFGDSSFNPWAVGFLDSEQAATFDGKPVLYYEQQPVLTDYDYLVRLDETARPVEIVRDYSKIYNWIVVKYKDANGKTQYLTPDDDANLTDTTSSADYGQRDKQLDYSQLTQTEATNAARRYLATYKDPQYNISGPVSIQGSVMTKQGYKIPACQIRAGKRLKVADYLQDLSGNGLTMLITQTEYDADSQTCNLGLGQSSGIDIALAQLLR